MTPDGGLPPEAIPPAARERVVERLTRLYSNDELTVGAFEDHLERVYAAASVPELDAIAAKLPLAPAAPGLKMRTFLSGQERKVVSAVPRELTLRARLGYVELDLTDATFEPGLTTVDIRVFMGYVLIRFPAGLRVETSGSSVFGFFSHHGEVASAGDASTSVVRVTGRATLGFAETVTH